jgi:poly(A)-specific ribonuclease
MEDTSLPITKHSFASVLPRFEKLLPKAQCVALDLEMTGIYLPGKNFLNVLETPEQRYKRVWKEAVDKYSVVQVGLCLYVPAEEGSEGCRDIVAHPFTFFVRHPTAEIGASAGALDFLNENSMDWNAWIKDGIVYCNEAEEQAAFAKHEEMYPATIQSDADILASLPAPGPLLNGPPPAQPKTPADHQALSLTLASIRQWLDTSPAATLHLPPTTPYGRMLIHQHLGAAFPHIAREGWDGAFDIVEGKRVEGPVDTTVLVNPDAAANEAQPRYITGRGIVLSRLSDEEKVEKYKQKRAENLVKMAASVVGFRKLWSDIKSECKKRELPIVGHNCTLDMLFLMRSLEAPLAGDFKTVMDSWSSLFPTTVDTKMLGDRYRKFNNNYDNANLAKSFGCLGSLQNAGAAGASTTPTVTIAGDGIVKQCHDAGYDAYMTGCIYLDLRERMKNSPCAYVNELYYMRSLGSIRLADPDQGMSFVLSNGGQHYVIEGVKNLNTSQIVEKITKLSGASNCTESNIKWCNKNSIVLHGFNLAAKGEQDLFAMVESEMEGGRCQTLEARWAQMDGGVTEVQVEKVIGGIVGALGWVKNLWFGGGGGAAAGEGERDPKRRRVE